VGMHVRVAWLSGGTCSSLCLPAAQGQLDVVRGFRSPRWDSERVLSASALSQLRAGLSLLRFVHS